MAIKSFIWRVALCCLFARISFAMENSQLKVFSHEELIARARALNALVHENRHSWTSIEQILEFFGLTAGTFGLYFGSGYHTEFVETDQATGPTTSPRTTSDGTAQFITQTATTAASMATTITGGPTLRQQSPFSQTQSVDIETAIAVPDHPYITGGCFLAMLGILTRIAYKWHATLPQNACTAAAETTSRAELAQLLDDAAASQELKPILRDACNYLREKRFQLLIEQLKSKNNGDYNKTRAEALAVEYFSESDAQTPDSSGTS